MQVNGSGWEAGVQAAPFRNEGTEALSMNGAQQHGLQPWFTWQSLNGLCLNGRPNPTPQPRKHPRA